MNTDIIIIILLAAILSYTIFSTLYLYRNEKTKIKIIIISAILEIIFIIAMIVLL